VAPQKQLPFLISVARKPAQRERKEKNRKTKKKKNKKKKQVSNHLFDLKVCPKARMCG
jgi:hypothetical protein